MRAEIYERAHRLAEAIAASEELAELRKTEKNMLENETALQIINDYQNAQAKLAECPEGEDIPEELRAQIAEIEERMVNNELISEYFNAQDRFTQMLDEINSILAEAIASGKEAPEGPVPSCSTSGCGGCSFDGCC